VSRFKDRKFTQQWDSLGTATWVPLEQVHALLCDAMKLEADNERLRKAGDAMDAYLKRQDGTTNGMLDCRFEWEKAKGVQS
jgi:hypothetical protein